MLLAPPSESDKCNGIYAGLQAVVADQDRLRSRSQLAALAIQQHRLNYLVKENSGSVAALQSASYKALQKLNSSFQQVSRRAIAAGLDAELAVFMSEHPEAAVQLRLAFDAHPNMRRLRDVLQADSTAWMLLQKMFPIWAMTPEEVTKHLPPCAASNKPLFDVVLFDEASQMPLHQALGCIARSAQCIVVGDDRQLPPREGMQGLLDECIRANMPLVPLQWHYRSSHQSLIDFSNELFYFGQLESFPAGHAVSSSCSGHAVSSKDQQLHGLIRVPVDGPMVSNFGRKAEIDNFIKRQVCRCILLLLYSAAVSIHEVEVAAAVFCCCCVDVTHVLRQAGGCVSEPGYEGFSYSSSPQGYINCSQAAQVVQELATYLRSLEGPMSCGIITLNRPQRALIAAVITARQLELGLTPDSESGGFVRRSEDPLDQLLFVQSIDQIQGEERDVILFSMLLAPRASGEDAVCDVYEQLEESSAPVDEDAAAAAAPAQQASGRLSYSTIAHAHGDRLLNVGLTRSRHLMKVDTA